MEDGKICPIRNDGSRRYVDTFCIGRSCAWYCGFAKECSISLLAAMFADSEICRNEFPYECEEESDG